MNISYLLSTDLPPQSRETTVGDGNGLATMTVGSVLELATTTVSVDSLPQYKLAMMLWRVVPPLIIVCGTFGNVMTILVMRGPACGNQSVSVYFTSLAVCDLAVLWIGLTRHWSKITFRFDIRTVHTAVCKLHKFLIFTLGRMATWLLVAVTTQRVMSVMWPLRHGLHSSLRRTVIVVLVIVSVCVLTDTSLLFTYSLTETSSGRVKCRTAPINQMMSFYHKNIYPWVNNVLGSLLPLCILLVNNSILAWKVKQSVKTSRDMAGAAQAGSREKTASSLSVTLVVTSAAFFLLTSSIPVGFFVKTYYLPTLHSGADFDAKMELVDAVLDLLWYCNSAVNFYLYCLTGTKFRNETCRLLCRCKNRQPRPQLSMTGSQGSQSSKSTVSNRY